MNKNISFIKEIKNPDGSWKIFFSPDFIDTTKTDFPDGLEFHFEGQDSIENLNSAKELCNHFFNFAFNSFEEEFKEDPEYFFSSSFNLKISEPNEDSLSYWTMVCWDIPENEMTLKPYIRIIPGFVDAEAAGSSWGFSVLNKFYESEENTFSDRLKIAQFMNYVIKIYKEKFIQK